MIAYHGACSCLKIQRVNALVVGCFRSSNNSMSWPACSLPEYGLVPRSSKHHLLGGPRCIPRRSDEMESENNVELAVCRRSRDEHLVQGKQQPLQIRLTFNAVVDISSRYFFFLGFSGVYKAGYQSPLAR